MSYSRAEFFQLTANDGHVVAFGELEWTEINGSWRATVDVVAPGFTLGEVLLQMKVPRRKPAEPTTVLIVRGEHAKRVDVNGEHRGVRETHVQWRTTPDSATEYESAPDWFYPVPLSDTVTEGAYRRVFQDSAQTLGVDIRGVTWNEPPEVG